MTMNLQKDKILLMRPIIHKVSLFATCKWTRSYVLVSGSQWTCVLPELPPFLPYSSDDGPSTSLFSAINQSCCWFSFIHSSILSNGFNQSLSSTIFSGSLPLWSLFYFSLVSIISIVSVTCVFILGPAVGCSCTCGEFPPCISSPCAYSILRLPFFKCMIVPEMGILLRAFSLALSKFLWPLTLTRFLPVGSLYKFFLVDFILAMVMVETV